jgi:redox-sensitive bicupin YhaK (pirin superfamily)
MQAGAKWVLPPASGASTSRTLYFFSGPSMRVGGRELSTHAGVALRGDAAVPLEAGAAECELLLLQGRPISEPVVQYGPFVMNTRAEIERAMLDYRRTGFGGWPWPVDDPVHGSDPARFARHADGRTERGGT